MSVDGNVLTVEKSGNIFLKQPLKASGERYKANQGLHLFALYFQMHDQNIGTIRLGKYNRGNTKRKPEFNRKEETEMKKEFILTLMLCLFTINCASQASDFKDEPQGKSNQTKTESNDQTINPPDKQNEKPSVQAVTLPDEQSEKSNDEQGEKSNDELKIPAEVKPFIEKGTKAIALESADLNGDATKDYILVLEKLNPERDAGDFPVNQRPLIVLIRDNQNKLSAVKRNEKMIMCSECGGVMGDPFEGVEIGEKTFTVNNYGGSGIRWSARYKFNYSRIDKTWQLVEVKKESYSTADVDKVKTKILTPKDFGKVDVADFDPEKLPENN